MNNQELLKAWVAALRSGQYEQTQGVLCDGKGYCCLGVLELVAEGEVEVDGEGTYRALPTWDFWDRIGTYRHNVLGTGIGHIELSNLNDNDGLCFAEIANRLEGK